MYGCGGGSSSGGSASFSEGNGNPVVDSLEVENDIILSLSSSEYNLSIKENTREAFKINATDRSSLTYALSSGDFNDLYIDSKTGETFFKTPTDYERKSKYKFKIFVTDSVGHETVKNIFIKIIDTKDEKAPIKPLDIDSSLTEEEDKYFITTWKTDNVGISKNNEIIIPTTGDGYNYSVDWGDGTSSKQLTLDAKHTYENAGTYKVKIAGKFPRIYFGKNVDYNFETYESDSRKILSIDQWGTNSWKSMAGAFTECTFLEGKASDTPDLSKVKDMSTMFAISSFNQDINNWNISNVENLQLMFFFSNFNQNIEGWDTSNVINMTGLFGLTSFNKSIASWDTSKVQNMGGMFLLNTKFDQNIVDWKTSQVTEMSTMFFGATSFNQNIAKWNTSNVQGMLGMFSRATSFNQDISNWNILKVKDMSQMFQSATAFNQDLERWHVGTSVNKTDMFTAADALDQLPTWYSVDEDIAKRDFIVIGHNVAIESCQVAPLFQNIEGNNFGNILTFNQDIDKDTLISSSKNGNFSCSEYGRSDELVDCTTINMEEVQGVSCVIGFNFKK